jgi:formylglycine-generating enzyme required for sulfatase activity
MSSLPSFGRSRASRVVPAALVLSALSVVVVSAACGNSDDSPGLINNMQVGGGNGGKTTIKDSGSDADSALDDATVDAAVFDAGLGCADGMKDNLETDVDCGGTVCQPCADGKMCKEITDCLGKGCTNNTCDTPTCTDKILNEDETDVDCGGSTCPKCTVGRKCSVGGDCTSSTCTGGTSGSSCGCPAQMVIVPQAENLGGGYCIDVTEVTKGQYNTFWAANYPIANQVAGCSGNLDYTPREEWPPALIPANLDINLPVHYVDWCDAYAYCTSVGKSLCGNIGGGKLPDGLDPSTLNKATTGAVADAAGIPLDAWYNACSSEGTNLFPYSATSYSAGACNGAPPDGGTGGIWADYDTSDNLANTSCFGGVTGVYQMSGNVAEWEDACAASTGNTDNCAIRGGAYDSSGANPTTTDLQCKWQGAVRQRVPDSTDAAKATLADVGFRCCQY